MQQAGPPPPGCAGRLRQVRDLGAPAQQEAQEGHPAQVAAEPGPLGRGVRQGTEVEQDLSLSFCAFSRGLSGAARDTRSPGGRQVEFPPTRVAQAEQASLRASTCFYVRSCVPLGSSQRPESPFVSPAQTFSHRGCV